MRLEQQLSSANDLQQCLEKQLERLRMEAAQTDSQSHMVFTHSNVCSSDHIIELIQAFMLFITEDTVEFLPNINFDHYGWNSYRLYL